MSRASCTELGGGRVDVPSEDAGEAGLLEQLSYLRLAVLENGEKDSEGASAPTVAPAAARMTTQPLRPSA